MKKIQLITFLSLTGLIACNNSETESKNKKTSTENKTDVQSENTEEVITSDTITDTISTKKNNTTLIPGVVQKKKNKVEKSSVEELSGDVYNLDKNNYITPGYAKNEFSKNGNTYNFKRLVKGDQDSRKGGSGGEDIITFSITNPADSFLIENEMLKTINFKYSISGEIYWAKGENPYKGKIKGILLDDKTWRIEANISIKTKDLQMDKEIERKIIFNTTFNQ